MTEHQGTSEPERPPSDQPVDAATASPTFFGKPFAEFKPRPAGMTMGWGIIVLVVAQLLFLLGAMESMSYAGGSSNAGPYFIFGLLLGAAGVGLIIAGFSHLSTNVEFIVRAEIDRRGGRVG